MDNKIILAIVSGVIAFCLGLLPDLVSGKGASRIRGGIIVLCLGLQAYALYLTIWDVNRFSIPVFISIIGWILLPVFTFLLIYSLYIELPSRKTYLASGMPERLVRTGTYALIRHPEVLWYVMGLIALILGSRSVPLLVAAPIWIIVKLICVTIQDKVIFAKMFADYDQYKVETPMLIPNRRSILACLRTIRIPTH